MRIQLLTLLLWSSLNTAWQMFPTPSLLTDPNQRKDMSQLHLLATHTSPFTGTPNLLTTTETNYLCCNIVMNSLKQRLVFLALWFSLFCESARYLTHFVSLGLYANMCMECSFCEPVVNTGKMLNKKQINRKSFVWFCYPLYCYTN